MKNNEMNFNKKMWLEAVTIYVYIHNISNFHWEYLYLSPLYRLLFYNKGIKNGCPCIVEIRGTQGCALVGDPARAVGECRDVAKAQP